LSVDLLAENDEQSRAHVEIQMALNQAQEQTQEQKQNARPQIQRNKRGRRDSKSGFFIKIKQDYNQTKIIALHPSFDYWNEKLVYAILSLIY
jgi:hypothetical protein